MGAESAPGRERERAWTGMMNGYSLVRATLSRSKGGTKSGSVVKEDPKRGQIGGWGRMLLTSKAGLPYVDSLSCSTLSHHESKTMYLKTVTGKCQALWNRSIESEICTLTAIYHQGTACSSAKPCHTLISAYSTQSQFVQVFLNSSVERSARTAASV